MKMLIENGKVKQIILEAAALSTNIRLGLKCAVVANTLAYNTVVSITTVERFVIQVHEKILSSMKMLIENGKVKQIILVATNSIVHKH